MTLSENRILRLTHFCVLYVAQGIPFGFVSFTLAAYLAKLKLPTDQIGTILALSTLPWGFKWVWGPLIDAVGLPAMGRRRPWILLAQSFMALTIAAMVAIPDFTAGAAALGWMVFIHNVFNSLQDVAVDALAVDLLPEEERGKANGLMFGSKYLGTFLGGAGLGTVLGWFGLRTALLVQVTVLAAIAVMVWAVRERPGEQFFALGVGRRHGSAGFGGIFQNLGKAFSIRATILGGVLALAGSLAFGILSVVCAVFLTNELGWSDVEYSQFSGGLGVLAGIAGSVAGGFLADRFGHQRCAALACALMAALWVTVALGKVWWHAHGFIATYLVLESLFSSVFSVSLFALFMGISWPKVAATQFTAYMALQNLSTTLGAKLAGTVEAFGGITGVYLTVAALQAVVVAVLYSIDPRQTRRVLGGGDPGEGAAVAPASGAGVA